MTKAQTDKGRKHALGGADTLKRVVTIFVKFLRSYKFKASYWLKQKITAFSRWFPLMTKKYHRLLLAQQYAQLSERNMRELSEAEKKIASIINRAGTIDWRHEDGDSYAMILRLDPRMFGRGYCSDDELKYLAKTFAHRVEAEIASSRFIQKAHNLERERHGRRW